MPKAAKGAGEAKPKKEKDPNAPKRPVSAYILYSNAQRDQVKKDNPGMAFGQIGKKLGEMWAAVDPKIKAKFEEEAKKDKERYEKEIKNYKASK